MKVKYFLPLVGFVVPTIVIGYGFVIPNSSIAGFNALTVGFSTTILGACAAYVTGVWTIVDDRPST
jgi:ABC-type Fe3+ transport system permease subunit